MCTFFQSLPVRHCSAAFHPMLSSSWKPRIIWVLFLVLSISPNSWQLLKRANDPAMESWDFESWSQLQVPPPAPTPLQAALLLSCPITITSENPSPPEPVSRLHTILWQLLIHSRLSCPPCTLSSALPSREMYAKVSENTGVWEVDTLRLCKHNKPRHAFLQINPHHHPSTPHIPQLPMGRTLIPQSATPLQLHHFHSFIFSSPQIPQAPSEKHPSAPNKQRSLEHPPGP